ncbi:hypothetical protein Cri9333_2470 [Crinalium epipsammum PCC 9333]|uniref:Uncharacterized protein n=1 Tax=Crinalium epipsammum PCC 9333 TaxID=1173022 RepID=K9W0R2_9CYAN|nr:hypothetical protein [Crinalium epipsammum]AFZ13337.1 hypothetical protein Cri9333_2470 [Crinalium epipsammum PCC 9333]
MTPIKKLNLVSVSAISVIAMIFAVIPVYALPGQNINTVIKWVKTKPQLPRIKYNSEAHGYDGTKKNLYFYADVPSQNGTVVKEGITVSNDSSIKFTQKNAKAVKLIQDIYNSTISNDFRTSKNVIKVGRDQFLRGTKFGYITAEVQGGSAWQITSLKTLQEEINNAKYCQTHQCDV